MCDSFSLPMPFPKVSVFSETIRRGEFKHERNNVPETGTLQCRLRALWSGRVPAGMFKFQGRFIVTATSTMGSAHGWSLDNL
jgi:hypothetical protein